MKFVLDTNMYLHYHSFVDRDWATLLGDSNLTLIVPPSILKELDEKKYDAQDTRIRKRAQEVIARLDEISDGLSTPAKFNVEFPTTLHLDEISQNLLKEKNQDNIIITEILALKKLKAQDDICLVTADLGMKLKAKANCLKVVAPPKEWKKEIKDPRDKKIVQQDETIKKLQTKMPDVQILLSSGNDLTDNLRISFGSLKFKSKKYTDEYIEEIISRLPRELKIVRPEKPIVIAAVQFMNNTIDKYNKAIEDYPSKYREYLKVLRKSQETHDLSMEISPVFVNTGTVPAEDVEVTLMLPRHIIPMKKLPPLPMEPQRPNFETFSESVYADQQNNLLSSYLVSGMPANLAGTDSGPIVDIRENTVKYWRNSLKHGKEWQPKSFFIRFRSEDKMRTFEMGYEMHINNYPEIKQGNLLISINEVPVE